MSKPSGTNYPNDFLHKTFSHPLSQWIPKTMYRSLSWVRFGTTVGWRYIRDLGGNSSGVPPLPIPNREVKPIHADGTAFSCGRVGSRLFKRRFTIGAFFVFCPLVADSGFNGAFLCLFFLCRRTFLFSVGHLEQTNLRWRGCLRNLLCAGFISPIRYGNFGLGLLFLIGMLWSKQGLLIFAIVLSDGCYLCFSYRVWPCLRMQSPLPCSKILWTGEAEGGEKFLAKGPESRIVAPDCCGRIRLVATVEKKDWPAG